MISPPVANVAVAQNILDILLLLTLVAVESQTFQRDRSAMNGWGFLTSDLTLTTLLPGRNCLHADCTRFLRFLHFLKKISKLL